MPLPSLLGLLLHPPRLVLLDTLFDLGLQFGVIYKTARQAECQYDHVRREQTTRNVD